MAAKTGPERRAEAEAKSAAVQSKAGALIAEIGDVFLARLELEFPDHGELVEALQFSAAMLNEAVLLRYEARMDEAAMRGEHEPVLVPTLKDVIKARDAEILAALPPRGTPNG